MKALHEGAESIHNTDLISIILWRINDTGEEAKTKT